MDLLNIKGAVLIAILAFLVGRMMIYTQDYFSDGIVDTVDKNTAPSIEVISIYGMDRSDTNQSLDLLVVEISPVAGEIRPLRINLTKIGVNNRKPIIFFSENCDIMKNSTCFKFKSLTGNGDLLLERDESCQLLFSLPASVSVRSRGINTLYIYESSTVPIETGFYVPEIPENEKNRYIRLYP